MGKLKTSKKGKPAAGRAVVIGTSAGGHQALIKLLSQLQPDFAAPVLVVQHISADASGDVLLDSLNSQTRLKCVHAADGQPLVNGCVYLAPSDHHLMVNQGHEAQVTKGATENRWRPAIDPLFRSAAVEYGNHLIGIILTGYLDDGTSGMIAIQKCGGICIVQDPADAEYPDMPKNVLNQLKPDYCLPLAEMGSLLAELLVKKPGRRKTVSEDVLIEAGIAGRVLSDLPSVNALGEQMPFNCPGCGGVLWQVANGKSTRYRCHTGHAYTAATLLAEQTAKLEETMWVALRMFEERKNLLTTIAKENTGAASRSAQERADLSQVHIERIRKILMSDDKGTNSNIPI